MAPSFLFSLAEHLVFIVYFSTFCTAQPILWQVLGLQNISWSQLPVHTCPTLPQLTFIFSPGLPQQPPVLCPGLPACSLQVSLHKAAVSCYSPVGSANTRYKIVENLKYRNLKLKGKKIKKFFKEKKECETESFPLLSPSPPSSFLQKQFPAFSSRIILWLHQHTHFFPYRLQNTTYFTKSTTLYFAF